MGEVYLVESVRRGRREALKILHPFLARDREFMSRFRREARVIQRLAQPAIVQGYDFGVLSTGRPYLAMEHIEGENLRARLRWVERLSVERALDVLVDLADAVDHAHARGVLHRDLKP